MCTYFTVYDFAHAEPSAVGPRTGIRMKKSAANGWVAEAKELSSPKRLQTKSGTASSSTMDDAGDSLAWYEKDLDDFDLSDVEAAEEEEEDDATAKKVARKCPLSVSGEEEAGKTYPADLWYMLGDYIGPEDVAVFSLLCQGSHQVTHTAGFWYRLYLRHYREDAELPQYLKPECIQRVHGIRPLVIMSLFYMYPVFTQRLQAMVPMECDPDRLVGARCLRVWYKQVPLSHSKNTWHFYFKFQRPQRKRCSLAVSGAKGSGPRDLLKADDINYNPEENCYVLQLILQNFVSLPPSLMGQVLAKTFVSVGHGMRFHKVKLIFNSEYLNNENALASGTVIILNPVINLHVIQWWNPKYPYQKK